MADEYAYWRECATGNGRALSPAEADVGQCGRWKFKRDRWGEYDRLAIWCGSVHRYYHQFNDEPTKTTEELPNIRGFAFARYASVEDYDHHRDNGVWPGEVLGLIRNTKVSDQDQIRENIETMAADAKRWLADNPKITTQTQADTAANYRTSLSALANKAKAAHKDEKAPLDAEIEACRHRWVPSIKAAEDTSAALLKAAEPFLVSADAAMKAERAAAKKALEDQDVVLAVLETPRRGSVMLAKVGAGGQTGRKMGVKTAYVAVITDYSAALDHWRAHAKVVEVIESLAQAAARSKEKPAIPGVEYKEEKKAI